MKKLFALLFAFMLAFSFVACNEGGDVSSDAADASNQDFQSSAATTSETSNSTEESETSHEASEEISEESSEDVSEEVSEEDKEDAKTPSDDIAVEESVIYDSNGIKMTVTGISTDNMFDTTEIEITVENNREDDISVSADLCSVNGIMVSALYTSDIAAGKKSKDTMSFFNDELELSGITVIKEIEFSAVLYIGEDLENYENIDVLSIKTTADESHVQNTDSSGDVVYDKNGIKIVAQKTGRDEIVETFDVYFYIENNTEDYIGISAADVSIDGFMINPLFYCGMMPNTKAVTSMSFFESDLDSSEEPSELEAKFEIADYYTWDFITETDIVTVTLN